MEKHTYVTDVLFDEEFDSEEEDDSNSIPPQPACGNRNVLELNQLLQKQHEIEQRTLEAAARSLSILKETEDIGNNTAKELEHQGEQLHHTNKMLDDLKAELQKSQKHINGMQSFFYEIKNFLTRKSKRKARRNATACNTTDLPDSSSKRTTPGTDIVPFPAASFHGLDVQTLAQPINNKVDDILESNLNEMAQHLTQLKGLSLEFGKQIDHQNEIIEAIQTKVEVAEIKIVKQNKQMNNLLGKN